MSFQNRSGVASMMPTSVVGVSNRGCVVFTPVSIGHTLTPSISWIVPLKSTGLLGSTPARTQKVAYQSATCTSFAPERVPRSAAGTNPPATNAVLRVPPSQLSSLCPRKGWLFPIFPIPPLSAVNTRSVLPQSPSETNASVTFFTAVSSM